MTILLLIRLLFRKQFDIRITRTCKYLFLVLIAMLVSFSATSQVTANFTTITSTTGCGSLVVEFKDLSVGGPTSWLWDFGNGNTSTLKNPIAIYNTPGVYDITLKVSDLITSDSVTAISLVEVYEKPIAVLELNSAAAGCMPLNVSFQDFSNTNTSIVSWQWDFGDGGASSIQNPNYTYISSGHYSVSLFVVDVNGCQSLATEVDLVEVNTTPIADFSTNITFSCDSLELVLFSNNSIDASVFIWDFGDGITSNLESPSHNFSSGIYTVMLYANEGSCMDTLVMTDLIEVVGYLSPDFVVDANSGCEELSVSFFDVTTNSPNTFLWDFGDGTTSILQNPTHVFDTVGVYDITLTTSMSGQCSNSVTFPSAIEVFPNPIISFTADTTLGCSIPFDVAFYDNTIDAVSWSWDFGDGNFSNIQNPSNIYASSGVFDVSLSVVNNDGCNSAVTFSNYMTVDKSPVVNFKATPLLSCAGEDISFSDLSSLPTNNWEWNFGDGDSSNIQNPIHKYELAGVYDVSLIAGINSCKDTIVISDYIKIIEPAAAFEEIYNCDDPLIVEFESTSIGADNVFWDFGDGTTSTLLNPTHTFLNLGFHTVSLSVNNNLTGCNHVLVKQIELTQPIAQFDYLVGPEDSVGCVPKRVYIDQQSQDCSWYKVLWSDGYVDYDATSRLFVDTGIFDATMVITDIHGCKDTTTIEKMYYMYDIVADFGITNALGCDSLFVDFENLSGSSSAIWDFGDGASSIINNAQHIYYNEGIYDVTLYAKSSYGCKDTLTRLEYIKYQPPFANFSSSVQEVCLGDNVQFTSFSEGVGISSVWSFGDGTSSNILHPDHEFIVNGMYDIHLFITDSFGCSDNLSLSDHIQVLSPIADFSSLGLSSNCPPLISNFINLSSSDASLFMWDFGDGSTSLIEDPSHLFVNPGLFDVSLIVENSFGCRDTLVQQGYVDMLGVMPMGSFVVSDTLICKNDVVSFIPTVVNTNSFLWDFGNGVMSTDSLATVMYSNPGIFMPTLIIENSSGCQLIVNSDDTVKVNEVIVDAGVSVEICEGESVQLNAVGNSSAFNWSPLNGLSSVSVSNPQASPTTSVFYYVNHTDGLCNAIDSVFVNVYNNVPTAAFTATNLCDGDLTSFVANSGLTTTNNSYLWSFGQNGQVVDAVLNVGNNNVALIIENLNNSCKDTLEQDVFIFENPVADFLALEEAVCLGESVNLSASLSSGIATWVYNFDDGIGVSIDQDPIYTYSNPGVYNVILNVVSDVGCEDDMTKNIIVHELPIVDFIIENNCEGDGNVFIDLSSIVNSGINSIEYNFNDGFTSMDSVSVHVFDGYGLFDVELTATSYEGCSNSKVKITEVFANPIVNFLASQFCEKEATIFHNFSFVPDADIISYQWSFGSEGSSVAENISHTFSSDGVFNVDLSVISDRGCESMLSKKITIHKLPGTNFKLLSDLCLGDVVEISYFPNANDANIVQWHYNFGDGNFSIEENPIHTYDYTGVFDVSLEVVSSKGCINDTVMQGIIEVHSLPIADFQASTFFASEISPAIDFYNHSEGAIFFVWDFDNGDSSLDESPTYRFSNAEIYNVTLTAINDVGCSAEMVKTVQINPEYTFFIPDAFSPNGDGLNDLFEAQGNRILDFEMQVFDRWGGVVFESSSIELGWDGNNASGDQLDDGIYLYHIKLYDLNERLWVYNGELKLMR